MPGFDDMMMLEDRARELTVDLKSKRDLARGLANKAVSIKEELRIVQERIESLTSQLTNLRSPKTQVVSMSEYQEMKAQLGENRATAYLRREEIRSIERRVRELDSEIKTVEALLKTTNEELGTFGKVLQFKQAP